MGESLIPDGQLPADWREALAMIARATRAALLRHPWAVQALQGRGAAAQDGPRSDPMACATSSSP